MVAHEVMYDAIGTDLIKKITYRFLHDLSKVGTMKCMVTWSIQYSREINIML